MTRPPSPQPPKPQAPPQTGPFALALLLAGLAGWVDAAGLNGAGGVFVSFMSGNTTIAALALAHQHLQRAAQIAAVLLCFIGGVTLGELLDTAVGRYGPAIVLALEALFLGLGAALTGRFPSAPWTDCLPLAVGMGLQNATMHSAGGVNVGLTYITGTLVQFGRTLAALLLGHGEPIRAARFGGLWLSLTIGATACGFVLTVSRPSALGAASFVALCLAGATAQSPPPGP